MTTQDLDALGPLTREERDIWFKAYISTLEVAQGASLKLPAIETPLRSLPGLVRFAVESAWMSLDAFRKAAKGDRS